MAHNLLGERFYNRSNTPAWHNLGINDPTDHSAEEALRRVGEFSVQKVPLKIEIAGAVCGFGMPTVAEDAVPNLASASGLPLRETGWYALVRDPIKEDNQYRVIGTPVTGDYEIIDPIQAAKLWDANVCVDGRPVAIETLGILGKGSRIFITTKLPSFDVRGDEVSTYLFFDSPLENNASLGVYTTPVRVVCQNTLIAGIGAATQRLQMVTHSAGASAQIGKWLSGVYGQAVEARALLDEAYNILANKSVKVPQIKWIIDSAYPMPNEPKEDAPNARLPIEERLKFWEINCKRVERSRELVHSLYENLDGTMDTKAVKGTAFGVFNAVSAMETYRRGEISQTVTGLINGARGARISNAYKLAMNVERYKTVSLADLELVSVYS